MAADLRALAFGGALRPASAARLRDWMLACRTSAARLPAGFPAGWTSGNKTGSGDYATANDVAFVLPPRRGPLVVAAYYTDSHATGDEQNATLAAAGRIVARALA
jgi:beta-lactamase class A